jgi:hypothetical protein
MSSSSTLAEKVERRLNQVVESVSGGSAVGKAAIVTAVTVLEFIATGPFTIVAWIAARVILACKFNGNDCTSTQQTTEQILRAFVCLVEWGPRSLFHVWRFSTLG